MEIDFAPLSAYERYKLMASLIVPRPNALVTTVGPSGVVNAAPFSMFNMLGEDPPILMLSVNRLQDGRLKDTAANILANLLLIPYYGRAGAAVASVLAELVLLVGFSTRIWYLQARGLGMPERLAGYGS